jgi:hypothetical protein
MHNFRDRSGANRSPRLLLPAPDWPASRPIWQSCRSYWPAESHLAAQWSMALLRMYGQAKLDGRAEKQTVSEPRPTTPTPSIREDPTALEPLLFRLSGRARNAMVAWYDVPGEDWELGTAGWGGDQGVLSAVRGLILLIDPTRFQAVARGLRAHGTSASRQDPAECLGLDLNELPVRLARSTNRPDRQVAVVLGKLDRWCGLLDRGTALHEVATRPMAWRLDDSFDQEVHDEAQALMERWGAADVVDAISRCSRRARWFAVSSLGDAAPRSGRTGPLALPAPWLVERPVIWLFRNQGIWPRELPLRSSRS